MVLSSIAIIIFHSTIAILSLSAFTLLLVASLNLNSQSVFVLLANSLYSVLVTPLIWITDKLFSTATSLDPGDVKANKSQQLAVLRVSAVAIPLVGAVIFILLYATANPLFSNAFNWISWDWISFTFWLGVLLAGICFYHPLNQMNRWQAQQGNTISRKRKLLTDTHPLALKFELKTAVTLLILLNILLLAFNGADLQYLLKGITQDPEFSHADFVHQGVYTLIISIVLAISILLYYFRGNMNFYKNHLTLKRLAYVWIAQNLLLAASITYKNLIYIQEFSLTYKRIGVFVYIILVVAGLLTTYVKVKNKKTTWYLLNINSWVALALLLISSFIPWDSWITRYNLSKSENPDINYLIQLSDANIPQLLPLRQNPYLAEATQIALNQKISSFEEREENRGWLSWNYQDYLTLKALECDE
ncbi:hypothetical protein GCM10011506_14220 [Marivirga lumbricoides]|uniref:DUF4173 domain-containing protein n=2 Tax=Marivirga lumbricoides TaxID=1046115 RepID=A0ABQ1LYT2_9BACT|nr:hypothetical protein GCM10011506_14220 [Marivirga lumbricoides]